MAEKKVTAKELERVVNNPETLKRVTVVFQKLLVDLERGLPSATSGEVLNSRMKW